MKTMIVATLGLTMMIGCNNAGFSGRTPQQSKAPAASTPQPAQPTTTTSTPTTTTTANATPGKPGILDTISGWIAGIPDIDVSTPNPNEVDFGSWYKVFHVGDGEMSDSSCKIGVSLYPRRGADYYFEFEVLQDATNVTVNIGKVCGIDYGDSNFASVTQGNNYLSKTTIATGARSLSLQPLRLNRGVYTVLVQSVPNPNKNNDRDDYLVGRVKILGDKPLKAGRVGARD